MPDPSQVPIAHGLNDPRKHNVGFKLEVQCSENFRQGGQHCNAQGIISDTGTFYKIGTHLVIEFIFRFVVGVEVGHHEYGRLAGRRPPDDTDRITIPVRGALISLVVRQAFEKDGGSFTFSESRLVRLPYQDDIGDDRFLY